jgi:hypothetical protein
MICKNIKEAIAKTIKWYYDYYQQKITIESLIEYHFNFIKKIK